jgi:hypothetical protein
MLQMSNAAAQLVVGPLFWRGVLCIMGGVRGDVLRHLKAEKVSEELKRIGSIVAYLAIS